MPNRTNCTIRHKPIASGLSFRFGIRLSDDLDISNSTKNILARRFIRQSTGRESNRWSRKQKNETKQRYQRTLPSPNLSFPLRLAQSTRKSGFHKSKSAVSFSLFVVENQHSAKAIVRLFQPYSPRAIFTGILAGPMAPGDHRVKQTNESVSEHGGGFNPLVARYFFLETRSLRSWPGQRSGKGRKRTESPSPRIEIRGKEELKEIPGRRAVWIVDDWSKGRSEKRNISSEPREGF